MSTPTTQASKVLLLGYVWPEPQSSAAGVRTLQLLEDLQALGYEVHLASHAQNHHPFPFKVHSIGLNHGSVSDWLGALKPDIVIYDRFVTEERYGWRVQKLCPKAFQIIDTQDLHFVRKTREKIPFSFQKSQPTWLEPDIFRELSSFHRVDQVWVVSDWERDLLLKTFHFSEDKIHLSRFHYSPSKAPRPFEQRQGFCFLGNFRHAPNLDACFWLAHTLWPKIRAKLPQATCTFYGAYPPKSIMALANQEQGLIVHGPVQDADTALSQHKALLAPLRFGAGIKGKVLQSFAQGTPVITTWVGAEGLFEQDTFPMPLPENENDFCDAAVKMHEDSEFFESTAQSGLSLLKNHYDRTLLRNQLKASLEILEESGNASFEIRMLNFHSQKANRYFSQWIELKESWNAAPNPQEPNSL